MTPYSSGTGRRTMNRWRLAVIIYQLIERFLDVVQEWLDELAKIRPSTRGVNP
jgi:hypothetical protein